MIEKFTIKGLDIIFGDNITKEGKECIDMNFKFNNNNFGLRGIINNLNDKENVANRLKIAAIHTIDLLEEGDEKKIKEANIFNI